MLGKVIYLYEYMDGCKKIHESLLMKNKLIKKKICTVLNMVDITDVDKNRGKRVWKDFEF